MVDVRFQDADGGAGIYDKNRKPGEPSYAEIYQYVWSIAFRPAPPVQALIRRSLKELNLQPGAYSATHIRHRYPVARDMNLRLLSENAVRCANQLYPNAPIYITSDTPEAIRFAERFGSKYLNDRVRGREQSLSKAHEHLDYSRSRAASSFYDVFVDLYLLAESRCVTHNVGGYGRWGRDLSYNQSCSIRHDQVNCSLQ